MFDQAQGRKSSKTDSILNNNLSVNSDLIVLMFDKTNLLAHKQES